MLINVKEIRKIKKYLIVTFMQIFLIFFLVCDLYFNLTGLVILSVNEFTLLVIEIDTMIIKSLNNAIEIQF